MAKAGGKPIILAGQKSGDVWSLDARTGEKIWNQKLGIGTALGGVHWGLTADARRLYAPISDPGVPQAKSAAGVHALDPSTGKVLWSWRVQPACDPPRGAKVAGCMAHAGISAAPIVLDQSVVAGGLDGRVWVLDAATGAVQAMHDTIATFDGINGVKGNGGSHRLGRRLRRRRVPVRQFRLQPVRPAGGQCPDRLSLKAIGDAARGSPDIWARSTAGSGRWWPDRRLKPRTICRWSHRTDPLRSSAPRRCQPGPGS